jgi:hypothetical protein
LGDKFYALADPGLASVSYVVASLKANQVQTKNDLHFDQISRSEQLLIELVNMFLKKCKVLNKKNAFKHSRVMHVLCVIICCEWYNIAKNEYGSFERALD